MSVAITRWDATNRTDGLAQNPSLGDHAFAVRGFPQRPGKIDRSPFLERNTHAQVLDPVAVEELVTEEGPDDGGDASTETGPCSAGTSVVGRGVHLGEKPVVRCALDLENLGR